MAIQPHTYLCYSDLPKIKEQYKTTYLKPEGGPQRTCTRTRNVINHTTNLYKIQNIQHNTNSFELSTLSKTPIGFLDLKNVEQRIRYEEKDWRSYFSGKLLDISSMLHILFRSNLTPGKQYGARSRRTELSMSSVFLTASERSGSIRSLKSKSCTNLRGIFRSPSYIRLSY